MIVDTSALVAIALQEPGFEDVAEALIGSRERAMSSVSILEYSMVLSRKPGWDSARRITESLEQWQITSVEFTSAHAHEAIAADQRFGKGRHPAKLNFGDCAAYATAKLAGEPLLYIGQDFALTDVESVL
jgi:ribonuclease VapC